MAYVYLKDYNHPKRSKQNMVAEHRVIVEKAINRILKDCEVVHHIDENKSNNTLNNLFLCKNDTEHKKMHFLNKQFLLMFNAAGYQYPKEFKKFDISNSRQDQLQEILYKNGTESPIERLYEFSTWIKWEIRADNIPMVKEYVSQFTSMEQLWLAFVMSERFGKHWSGKEWVTTER